MKTLLILICLAVAIVANNLECVKYAGFGPYHVVFNDPIRTVIDYQTYWTFSWTVTEIGDPALSHFDVVMCLDGLTIVDHTGPGNFIVGRLPEDVVLYGIKWDSPNLQRNVPTTFTVTFLGEVCTDEFSEVYLKGGKQCYIYEGAGPMCHGDCIVQDTLFKICGRVCLDINEDQVCDSYDPGISNVYVDLYLGDAYLGTQMTNENGEYSFEELATKSNYWIRIQDNAGALAPPLGLFLYNATLLYTGPVDLTNEQDSCGHDFPFFLNYDEYHDKPTTGRTIGFWKHNFNVYCLKNGKGQMTAAQLHKYYNTMRLIEPIGLVPDVTDEYYVFDQILPEAPMNIEAFKFSGYCKAALILGAATSDPAKLLLKQLLGLEMNTAAEIGLDTELWQAQTLLVYISEVAYAHRAIIPAEKLLFYKDLCEGINQGL